MAKKILLLSCLFVLLLTVFVIWNSNANRVENRAKLLESIGENKATVVASATCGCCKLYAQYLEQQGFAVDLDLVSPQELEIYKNENQIPNDLRSCHTTKIGNYIIEGHIPIEGIEKLFKEKPAIRGIGMAGMPLGSPGMPGSKQPFLINVITDKGTKGDLFVEL